MSLAMFQKKSIRWNPLAGARDLRVLITLIACTLAALAALHLWVLPPAMSIYPIAAGAFGGTLPSLMMCAGVRGTVPASCRTGFFDELSALGFRRANDIGGDIIYQHKSPRWLSWDSNRAVMRPRDDGDLDATIPLYAYQLMNRRTRGATA